MLLGVAPGSWSSVEPRDRELRAAAQAQRVVDAVGLGDHAPARRVAVRVVGDRRQASRRRGRGGCEGRSIARVVGFWPALVPEPEAVSAFSAWASSRSTVARIGSPLGWNRTYWIVRLTGTDFGRLHRAPAERDERRGRTAATAAAVGLHHLQELVGGVLDALVGGQQRHVEQQAERRAARQAAAELAVGQVDARRRLEVPDVGLRDRVARRVERALDRCCSGCRSRASRAGIPGGWASARPPSARCGRSRASRSPAERRRPRAAGRSRRPGTRRRTSTSESCPCCFSVTVISLRSAWVWVA